MSFELEQTFDSASERGNDNFGDSVSLYGNYLVLGDYNAKTEPDGKGAVYFYRNNSSSGKFDLIQTIDSPSGNGNDAFGVSLSLYGNYLVVGDNMSDSENKGAVYFYRINPSSGKFDLIQTIPSATSINNNQFGISVSLYGNYLIVGDITAKPSGLGTKGAAYFYRINSSSGKFDLIQTIDSPSKGSSGDFFGISVSLYGNYLVVGDYETGGNNSEGAAYFYRVNPSSGKFDLIQTIDSPSEGNSGIDNFGYSVSLYANHLVIGDINAKPDGEGAAYFYRVNPSSGKFDLIQSIDSPSAVTDNRFGEKVSLYGNHLVIGDYESKSGTKGTAYFYRINSGSGKFDLIQSIDSPLQKTDNRFALRVCLYGNYLIVTDQTASGSDPDTKGAAYFYRLVK